MQKINKCLDLRYCNQSINYLSLKWLLLGTLVGVIWTSGFLFPTFFYFLPLVSCTRVRLTLFLSNGPSLPTLGTLDVISLGDFR